MDDQNGPDRIEILLLLLGVADRLSEMFISFSNGETRRRLWDWCYFGKMTEGTKSLYLSAALYFSANFVTNHKLVADPGIT